MKKNKVFGIGVGTTSIMLIFVVMCLVITATLSYMIVKSDSNILEKKIEHTIRYQMADNVAVDTLSEIDEKLYEISSRKIVFDDTRECNNIMASLKNINVNYEKKQIAYKVGLEDKGNLEVLLKINLTSDKLIKPNKRYTVLQWKVVREFDNLGKDTLNVWK